jgi:NADH dehydrogenase
VIIGVTGATGFVGRHIVDLLVERGHRPRVLVRRPAHLPFRHPAAVDAVPGNLADLSALATLVRGAEAVIHLVGIIVERGTATFRKVQVEGTAAVVAAARGQGVGRFVHMSALGARDTAEATPYHRTKAAAERVVADGGMPHTIFRPSFISGPGNVPIAALARLHRFAPIVPIFGDGTFPMQPVWIGDVAEAFALAAEGRTPAGTWELGGPAAMSYTEFVRAIGRACRHPRPTVHVPLALVRLGARLGDVLGAAAPITSDQLQMLVEGTATPHNAIETVFGIKPLEFEEGLRRFLGTEKNQTRG